MATLENLRKRGPLVAGFIGFALLMFIVSLSFDNGNTMCKGDPYNLAKINGVKIDYRDYENKVKEATENEMRRYNTESLPEEIRQGVRDEVWENMVQMIILEGEYESAGLDVSADELADLIQGKNIDPLIYNDNAFKNESGVFDPAIVVNYYKNMDQDKTGEVKKYLLSKEEQVKQNRKIRKYFTLVEKGLYYPKPLAETEFKNRNYLVDFDYVVRAYAEISDSAITVSQSDLESYYKEHKNEYEQEASRDIAYVSFDVIPSQKDTLFAQDWINKRTEEFKKPENKKQFINLNSDVNYDPSYLKKGDIEYAELDSFAFLADTGKIFGPYFENGSYKVAKILDIKVIPDTIEAKHIFIHINGTTIPDKTRAKIVADSLKKVIDGGGDFAALAKEFSADKLSLEKGGDLGKVVYNQYVNQIPLQPFNELMDKKINELVLVEKDYGIHLLEKTSAGDPEKKVQVGIIERKVAASTETFQKTFALASKFAGENRNIKNFDAAITKLGYTKGIANGLDENGTKIPGLESPRKLIKWAYEAKTGDVSDVFELGKRYVVGTLVDIKDKGIAPLKQVESIVRQEVIKNKKAEKLIAQYNQNISSGITGLAQKFDTEIREAKNVSFSSRQISGMGYEPNVIAVAVTSQKGKVSQPIQGMNGVYVLSVKIITDGTKTEGVNLSIEQKSLANDLQGKVGGTMQFVGALRESAVIKDNRFLFF